MCFPSPYIKWPTTLHEYTIIFLHGRGSDGHEFANDLFESHTSSHLTIHETLPSWKWVFPSAKTIYDTRFQEDMTEWFDIYSLTHPNEAQSLQLPGLKDAAMVLDSLIRKEAEILGSSRKVVLAGISQGMATALATLLAALPAVGAFIGLSGWLPLSETIRKAIVSGEGVMDVSRELRSPLKLPDASMPPTSDVRAIPFYIAHGMDDTTVGTDLRRQAARSLQSLAANVGWHQYEGAEMDGHWLKEPEQFDDLVLFLRRLMN